MNLPNEQPKEATRKAASTKQDRISTSDSFDRPVTQADLSQLELRITERIDASENETAKQFGGVNQRIDASENETTKQFGVVNQQISALTQRIDAVTRQVSTLTQQVNTLTQQVSALTGRVDYLANAIKPLVHFHNQFVSQIMKLFLTGIFIGGGTGIVLGLLWLFT